MIHTTASARHFPIRPLGSVVEFLDHLRRPVKVGERPGGDYPYFGANGQQGTINGYIFDEPLVLLAEDGGHFDNPERGIAYRISGKTWVNNHAHVLRPRDGMDVDFLYRILENRNVAQFITGSTRAKLTKSGASQIPVPVPPLGEQRRIAQVLDSVDALRAKRHEAIALLDDLARSIFLGVFGNPNQSCPRVTVEDVAEDTKGAIRTGPFGSQLLHDEFVDSGVSVLGIDNAVTNEFQWMGQRFIPEEKYKKLARYTVYPGDVLITIMGTCGRCAVVPDDIPIAINTKHLCCITLDQSRCLPEFLHSYFLMHSDARRYLSQTAKGAIMDGLNMAIIKRLPIMLPRIDLQQVFVNRIRLIRAAKATYTAHLAELDALFASLQHSAFRGQLWVDSPVA